VPSDVIFPVNVSALCVTRPEKASTVFYRWIYFDKAEGKSIVGFCSWFRKQWLKKPSNRKQKSGVQNTALGTGSGRFPKPYGSASGVSSGITASAVRSRCQQSPTQSWKLL
jgi:hypothetical protein